MAMICLSAASLSAQRVMSTVDVTGTGVWYADSIRAAGTSIAPALRLEWPSATLAGSFTLSHLSGGGSSIQGGVAPSLFTPSIGPFSAELAGSVGGSSHHDGTRTGAALGLMRVYATKGDAAAWAGAGGGSTWDGSVWRRVRQKEVGAWIERNNVTTVATVAPVVVEDTLSYTDTELSLRYATSGYELGLTGGWRSGSVGLEIGGTSRTWGSLSALAWISSRVAIVASAGSYPVDFTQGYPGGRYATLALRIASRGVRRSSETTFTREVGSDRTVADARPIATDFAVQTASGRHRTIRIEARGAQTVEINSDFTRWRPTRLERSANGSWVLSLPLAAGTYQVNIRIDGGAWVAPPGLLTSTDEFGGVVGILVVE
jgi:hypothetical protein